MAEARALGDSDGPGAVVFLVDVDNTLLDNDGVRDALREHLASEYGDEARDRYWTIEEQLFAELGYRDYLGAVERVWRESGDMRHLGLSSYLVEFPFSEYVYPGALAALARLRESGPTVILTDGDAVFQPLKVARSGLLAAAGGDLLVYVHKERELDDVQLRYPAVRYVLVDDKPHILAAAKRHWGERVTTVLPLQGQFANDPKALASNSAPDVTIAGVGDLCELSLDALLRSGAS